MLTRAAAWIAAHPRAALVIIVVLGVPWMLSCGSFAFVIIRAAALSSCGAW